MERVFNFEQLTAYQESLAFVDDIYQFLVDQCMNVSLAAKSQNDSQSENRIKDIEYRRNYSNTTT